MPDVAKLMAGKRGLVMGVANDRSIAWGIARACHEAGAELAFTYQGAAFGKRVIPMVEKLGSKIVVEADVENEGARSIAFRQCEPALCAVGNQHLELELSSEASQDVRERRVVFDDEDRAASDL